MGAIANMAPDKYRVILSQVPFVDVVTTMLDASIPLTTNEYDEWGNPEKKEYYDYMLSYSPYDNLKAQAYPAMFVGTGLWDSQVQYFEPAKYVARLRDLNTGDAAGAVPHQHGRRPRRQVGPLPPLPRARGDVRVHARPARRGRGGWSARRREVK